MRILTVIFLLFSLIIVVTNVMGQDKYDSVPSLQKVISTNWSEKIKVSGYMQFRNNDL